MHRARLRQRDEREFRAIAHLRALMESTSRRHVANAMELGRAAVKGEQRASAIPQRALASIGWSVGCEPVRRRRAVVTASNLFKLSTLAVST